MTTGPAAAIREHFIDPANWLGNKRLPGESFDEFRLRRAHENRGAKEYHKGGIFWNSANLEPSIDLTMNYVRDIGGGWMLVLGENGHVSRYRIPMRRVLKRGTYRKVRR